MSQSNLSPENYMKTRARLLPLGDCYITRDWRESGMAAIIVTRKHITGFLTFAAFQVDLYCLGVKDAHWQFNEPPNELDRIMAGQAGFAPDDPFIKADYVLVHNIIYSALDYAEELGFKPHKDFKLAQFVLEEDDEKIDFIDIEFGLNGKPAIFPLREKYPSNIIPILQKSVGPGNFHIITEDFDDTENDLSDDEQIYGSDKPMNQDMINLSQERLMKLLGEQNFSSEEEIRAFLDNNLVGKKIDEVFPEKSGPKTNAEKADDLMYEAYQQEGRKGLNLARKALETDPESVRALIHLAQYETEPEKAEALLEKAIQFAEKKLGEVFFKKNRGNFWGIVETRPFMTARYDIARCKELLGKDEEAMKIYQEMLKLNPNDNQAVRVELARLYLKHYKLDLYHKLYKKYKEDTSAWWTYHFAYFAFLVYGERNTSSNALINAVKSNEYVIRILTTEEALPEDLSDYYAPGSKEEASYYLMDNLELWTRDIRAIEWLVREYKKIP